MSSVTNAAIELITNFEKSPFINGGVAHVSVVIKLHDLSSNFQVMDARLLQQVLVFYLLVSRQLAPAHIAIFEAN